MAEHCALSLWLGVRFLRHRCGLRRSEGLTLQNTECTLELAVVVAVRLLSDGRDLHLTPAPQEHVSGGLRRDSAHVNWSMILEHQMSTSNNRDR